MIIVVEWNTFHAKYLTSNAVYVKETDSHWEFYSSDIPFIIKSVVEKKGNEHDIRFVELYLIRPNLVKVLDVVEVENFPEEDSSETESKEAIRDEDETEEIQGITSTDNEHNHTYIINNLDGQTFETNPKDYEQHIHQIINGSVQEQNNHTHNLNLVETLDGD